MSTGHSTVTVIAGQLANGISLRPSLGGREEEMGGGGGGFLQLVFD